MNNPIKHHFVPQCYLKKFSSDNIKVHYYDKTLKQHGTEDIEKICQIPNLYKLSQSDPYYIETQFFANNIEDKLGRILSSFDKNDFSDKIIYDKNHRQNLAKQIVLQYMRTPYYRDTKSKNELFYYYEIIKQILQKKINFEIEEIEYKPINKAEFHKTVLLEDLDEVISNIAEVDWELLYTNEEFYTSDNPVTILSRQDMPVTYCDAIKYFSELFYPLNSKLILHIIAQKPRSPKKIDIRLCEQNKSHIINKLIIDNAKRYVIYKDKFNPY